MAEIDISHIKVSGPAKEGKTGDKISFQISGIPLSELLHGLKFEVDGPDRTHDDIVMDHECKDISCIKYYFVPLVAGEYLLHIWFKHTDLIGSPFKTKITGKSISAKKLVSKVKVHGRSLEVGEAFCINEFFVDCSAVQPVIGLLKIHVKCPEHCSASLHIQDNKNGTYLVSYKPIAPGNYKMDIKIADEHIPGSPFDINVHISRRQSLTIVTP